MKRIAILVIAILATTLIYGQKATDNITLNYDVSSFENIRIHNFKGNVSVKTKPGNTLSLKVKRTLKAKTGKKLEAAKQEVYLDTTIIDNELVVFMVAPQKYFKIDKDGNSYYQGNNWNNWSKNDIKEYDVEYEFEIEASVPANRNIYAATHHKDVGVYGVQGNTTVKSHHGNVMATTGGDEVVARSHHGDVTVHHTSRSVSKGEYKTHHGDIKTSFPALSAKVTMASHHGSYFIDFDYEHVAQEVSMKKDGKTTKYKYGGDTSIKVGSGLGRLTYKTHHGDTYIINNKK